VLCDQGVRLVCDSSGFDWLDTLVGAGVGFVVGVIVYLLTDANREPNLVFTPQSGDIDGNAYRFLHVLVANKRRSFLFRWRDRTANYARCYVAFIDPATRQLLLRIDGRWASGPEPYDYIHAAPDPSRIIVPQREVLPIGEEGFAVDVALKYEGDLHFYAFNNENYLPADDGPNPWQWKRHRLDHDHLLVEVEVVAEGHRQRSRSFVIRNPNKAVVNFTVSSN
jgi:hypothetical protein